MSSAPVMMVVIICQMDAAKSLIAVHAPCQLPVNTFARKSMTAAIASRKGWMSAISVFQMVLKTEMIVSPQVSQNLCRAPKMVCAALDRAFHRVSHRVLIPSQIREKDSITAAPFSSHQSDRAPKMVCAACLMTPHIVSRNSFTVVHAFNMVCLAFSAPIPALSNREPIKLLSPLIKAMKSWIRRTMTVTTAMIANIFSLAASRALSIFWSVVRKVSSLGRAITPKAEAATVPMIRNRFSVPPTFSASHSNRTWTCRSTSMTTLKDRTIVVPIASEMPRVSSMSATHKPNWLRIFSMASEIL